MKDDGTLKKYRLEELSQLSGIARRTIRFYIQKGLLQPPYGEKRGAYYTNEHLENLLKIKRLSTKHVPLKEISSYPEEDIYIPEPEIGTISMCSHIYLGSGLTLVVDAQKMKLTAQQLKEFSAEIVQVAQKYKDDTRI